MRVLAAVAPAVLIATLLAVAAAALTGFPWWPAAALAVLLAVLVLPVVVYLQVLKRNERFYRSEIARGLTRALDSGSGAQGQLRAPRGQADRVLGPAQGHARPR